MWRLELELEMKLEREMNNCNLHIQCEKENTVKLLSFNDGNRPKLSHKWCIYVLYIVYMCHYDNNRFISFSNFLDTLIFLCFFYSSLFRFHFFCFFLLLLSNWQQFFLLKLIILTLGQPYTNNLLLLLFYALITMDGHSRIWLVFVVILLIFVGRRSLLNKIYRVDGRVKLVEKPFTQHTYHALDIVFLYTFMLATSFLCLYLSSSYTFNDWNF